LQQRVGSTSYYLGDFLDGSAASRRNRQYNLDDPGADGCGNGGFRPVIGGVLNGHRNGGGISDLG